MPEGNVSRRSFMGRGAVAAGAAVGMAATLPPMRPGRADTAPQWRMRLSTSSIHFMALPIEEACRRIAKLGFEAVDIWSAHNGCPHLDDVLERLGAERLKALLAKHDLKLAAFSVYKGGYERYAKLLGDLGGGVAVRGSTKPNDGAASLTANMREFIGGLNPLLELAEANDSYLAIENHGAALLNTLDSFRAFVDLNTSPRLGIALAPYHLQRIEASVPEAIRLCGNQLLFFYAWQNASGNRQLPGMGPADMRPWIESLSEIKYSKCINPFMHGHLEPHEMEASLGRSRDYLKALLK